MAISFAVSFPNVGEFADPRLLLELAVSAEEHGWDGVFLWDHVLYHDPQWPVVNPTVTISAIAAMTSRVRIGVLMAALPRRRVQIVARETATLDVLSGGRLIVGAGLGSMDREYAAFGEPVDLKQRAGKLDETLEALAQLWTGQPVTYHGDQVTVDDVTMLPTPVQSPRIPIWCPGRWPTQAGFKRAARWDGVMPTHTEFGRVTMVPPSEFAVITAYLEKQRGGLEGFDVALEGTSRGAADLRSYVDLGMTWWVEAMGWWRGGVPDARARIAAGPPG